MYTYELTSLTFKENTIFRPGNLTVLIGPNNVGKSRALADIVNLTTGHGEPYTKILKEATWKLPSSIAELAASYDVARQEREKNWFHYRLAPTLSSEHSSSGGFAWPDGYVKAYDHRFASQDPLMQAAFRSEFGDAMVAFLTTEHRLQLVKESPSASREGQEANVLQALYNRGSGIDVEMNKVIAAAFGQCVKLDFTTLQHLLMRVGDDFSAVPADPRDARSILERFETLDEQGDGIRSFVGIVVAVLAIRRPLLLIDEPEAFLHPPQAFRIGEFLAASAMSTRQIVVATHSVDVLRGIVNHTRNVDILRLDRTGDEAKIRHLDSMRLKGILDDPLLSSARVLDGLFYSGAVVVEADSDARFYHRASGKLRPDIDLHFVNADNKQTVPRIMSLYTDMGVRSTGIVDMDVLNNEKEFTTHLTTLAMPEGTKDECLQDRALIAQQVDNAPLETRLARINSALQELNAAAAKLSPSSEETDASDSKNIPDALKTIDRKAREMSDSAKAWQEVKERGLAALTGSAVDSFNRLATACASVGLFINPKGELESMLTDYGVPYTTDKRAWIRQALPLLEGLQPDDGKQPWKFVTSFQTHLAS